MTELIDRDALKYLLSLPKGRKVIWDLLTITGLYRQPRVVGDPAGTEFNCGQLNVGLIIWAELQEASPELTALLIREQGTYDNDQRSDDSSRYGSRTEPRSERAALDSGRSEDSDPVDLGFGRFSRVDD